jgi:WD40 repeat protein
MLEGYSDSVTAVAFSLDNKILVLISEDRIIRQWDTGSGAVCQTLKGHSDSVNAMAFLPDSKISISITRYTIKL